MINDVEKFKQYVSDNQVRFAKELGVSRQRINYFLKNFPFKFNAFVDICNAAGVNIKDLTEDNYIDIIEKATIDRGLCYKKIAKIADVLPISIVSFFNFKSKNIISYIKYWHLWISLKEEDNKSYIEKMKRNDR